MDSEREVGGAGGSRQDSYKPHCQAKEFGLDPKNTGSLWRALNRAVTPSHLCFGKVLLAGKISGETRWEAPYRPRWRGLPWSGGMEGRLLLKAGTQWQQMPRGQRAPEPLGNRESPSTAGEQGLRAGRALSPFRLL